MRLGILGSDSTHVDAFLRHYNDERRFAGLEITVALAENDQRDGQLRQRGVAVLDDVTAVVAECDGIIVAHRDGRRHAAGGQVALRAGKRVYIDKPLATSVAGGRALIETATEQEVCLGTGSVMQFHPGLPSRLEPSDHVMVRGPADPDSPHAGLFFYGIHAAEAACAAVLSGPGPAELPRDIVVGHPDPDTTVIGAQLAGTHIEIHLVRTATDFTLATGAGVTTLALPCDYLAPVSRRIARTMGGEPLVGTGPALAAVALLEAATSP